ncbi:MAG: ribonuclease P protein component [Ruminococcaceae bacterium]|nr:ribonuclease P protein component [Oscillospiraceae bacterium]
MKYSISLKENRDFRRLYSKGRSKASSRMVVYCRKNRLGKNRIGITVSTKLGCAVKRNRIRRRMREAYRLNEERFEPGNDIVIVVRGKAMDSEFSELTQTLLQMSGALGLLKPDPAEEETL